MENNFASRYHKKFGDTVEVSISVPPDECSGKEECQKAETCVEIADTFTFKLRPDGVANVSARRSGGCRGVGVGPNGLISLEDG